MATPFAEAGHHAVTVIDQQMSGEKDQDIAAVCLNEGGTTPAVRDERTADRFR